MRLYILSSIALYILIFPTNSQAFTFDFWVSGYSLKKAYEVSQQKGINLLQKHGLSFANSKYYKTSMFNHETTVTLHFTEKSDLLYQIDVTWYGTNIFESRKLLTTIGDNLEKKYGKVSNGKGTSTGFRNGRECKNGTSDHYSVDDKEDRISISLSSCFNNFHLRYTNYQLSSMHFQELTPETIIPQSDINKL